MKRWSLTLLCALLIVSLTACGGIGALVGGGDDSNSSSFNVQEYESAAEKVSSDTVYYNDYLGVSFKLPGGWWVYDLNEENFATTEGITGDSGSLDIFRDDDYVYMWLLDCANLQDSSKDNHIGIEMDADKMDDTPTLSDYMDYYEWYMTEQQGYSYESKGTETISGQHFETRVFEVPQNYPYYLMSFTCEVGDGYYFTALCSYWPENTDAVSYITQMLKENLVVQTPDRPVI